MAEGRARYSWMLIYEYIDGIIDDPARMPQMVDG
jgi:hypothetical protein